MDERAGTRLTSRAAAMEYTAIRSMFERASELAGERDLVHLEIGEPDFDTPEHIVEAAHEAASTGETHYTSSAGIPALQRAIADRPEAPESLDPERNVVVTTGAMEALYLAFQAVAGPGEEVVIPTPAWPNYEMQVRLAGAEPVFVPLSPATGFALDAEAVIDRISPDTAAVVLTSPSNPTGQVYDTDAVRAVVAEAVANDCFVIADEAYDAFVYEGPETGIASIADDEWVLTVNTCSKRYAMTGWRVGWLTGPADVVDAVAKIHGCTSACAPSVSQHAAVAALTGPQTRAAEMARTFESRREYVVDRVAMIPELSAPTPAGAIYLFLDVSVLPGTSVDIATRLLEEYGVVTAPGSGFGAAGEGYLRLSFANSTDRLAEGFDRIERMVAAET